MVKTKGGGGELGSQLVDEPLLHEREDLALNLQHPLKGSGYTLPLRGSFPDFSAGVRGRDKGTTGTFWPAA